MKVLGSAGWYGGQGNVEGGGFVTLSVESAF